jgi:hypothetical protein
MHRHFAAAASLGTFLSLMAAGSQAAVLQNAGLPDGQALSAATAPAQLVARGPMEIILVPKGPAAAVSAVPEPASWAMMLLGFGGLGAVLRRRRTALA